MEEISEKFPFVVDNEEWSSFLKNDSIKVKINDLKKILFKSYVIGGLRE